MPDFLVVSEANDQFIAVDEVENVAVSEVPPEVLFSTGIQGPPGPPGPVGPMGPPNTVPLSALAGNGLSIAADGGLFVPALTWASSNW